MAKAALRPQELLAEEFRLNPKEMQELRLRIMPTLLQANGILGKAVVEPGKATIVRSGCVGCHQAGGIGSQWGPSLQSAGNSYSYARLRRRLTDTRTGMYHSARELGVLWSPITDTEVFDLASYLQAGIPGHEKIAP